MSNKELLELSKDLLNCNNLSFTQKINVERWNKILSNHKTLSEADESKLINLWDKKFDISILIA